MKQAPPDIQRMPPHSAESEHAAISSMLHGGPNVIEDCRAVLRSEAFYLPQTRKLFELICFAHDSKMALDLVTFTQELRDGDLLDDVGGHAGVTEIFNFVPSAVNIDYYLEIIREKWIARETISRCADAARKAMDESNNPIAVLEEVQSELIEIGQISKTSEALRHISEAVPEVVASIEATYHNRGKPIGASTGFVDLDRMCGGFQAPKTYYIGARPAMGKSSLGTEFAEHVAIDNAEKKGPVAVFSVEMTTHELAEVILCRRSSVDLVKLRDGFFSKEQRQGLLEQAEELKRAAIYIDDTAALTIFEFRARARRAVTKLGVKLIIIDYIQRMKSTSKRAQGNREQEINEIAQGISETAKELKVPIVVLAQLNRKNEERADKTPELSDFRESGSLEQEAHLVGLLHRPSYYCNTMLKARQAARKLDIKNVPDEDDSEKDDATAGWFLEFQELTQLIIAKQRRGPVGIVRLRFIRKYAQFQSEDEDRPLFSNRAEERQSVAKDEKRWKEEKAKQQPPGAAERLKEVQQILPGATLANGEDQPKSK